jgi:hypothetical protein
MPGPRIFWPRITSYRDTFLQKPPGSSGLFADIPGTGSQRGCYSRRYGVGLCSRLRLIYRIGHKIGGSAAGLWAAAAVVLCLMMPLYQAKAANTETFMIVASIGSMACLWSLRSRRKPVRGCCHSCSACIFTKQVAIYHTSTSLSV